MSQVIAAVMTCLMMRKRPAAVLSGFWNDDRSCVSFKNLSRASALIFLRRQIITLDQRESCHKSWPVSSTREFKALILKTKWGRPHLVLRIRGRVGCPAAPLLLSCGVTSLQTDLLLRSNRLITQLKAAEWKGMKSCPNRPFRKHVGNILLDMRHHTNIVLVQYYLMVQDYLK